MSLCSSYRPLDYDFMDNLLIPFICFAANNGGNSLFSIGISSGLREPAPHPLLYGECRTGQWGHIFLYSTLFDWHKGHQRIPPPTTPMAEWSATLPPLAFTSLCHQGERRGGFTQLVAKGVTQGAWSPSPPYQGITRNCVARPKPTAPPIQAHIKRREDLLLDPISNMSANNAESKQSNAFVYHGREGENSRQCDSGESPPVCQGNLCKGILSTGQWHHNLRILLPTMPTAEWSTAPLSPLPSPHPAIEGRGEELCAAGCQGGEAESLEPPPHTPPHPRNNGELCGLSKANCPSNPSLPWGEGGFIVWPNIKHERQQCREQTKWRLCLPWVGGGCDSCQSPPIHQGDSCEGIPWKDVDECGTSQWDWGDLGGGISTMHLTLQNLDTPLCQGNQGSCIFWLLWVDNCNSQWWPGGDWVGGIFGCTSLVQITIPPAIRAIKDSAYIGS